MTHGTFERAVRDWLDDGSDRTPRPAIDAVLLAVKTTPQQRTLWSPRRFTFMQTYTRLAAIAALVAVAGIGAIYLGGAGARGGPGTTATPTAAPPTAAPTASTTLMEVQGDAASWTAALPPTWSPRSGWFTAASQGHAGPTGVSVAATGAVNVPSDPCDGTGKFSDAKSPADVIAALQARKDLTVSTPTAATLGGHAGLQVDVELPADLSACGKGAYIIFAEPDGSGFYAQGPANRMRIWVLDVQGRPVVFLVQSFPATPATDTAAAQQIVDSIVITP